MARRAGDAALPGGRAGPLSQFNPTIRGLRAEALSIAGSLAERQGQTRVLNSYDISGVLAYFGGADGMSAPDTFLTEGPGPLGRLGDEGFGAAFPRRCLGLGGRPDLVSPEVVPPLSDLIAALGLRHRARRFEAGDAEGFALVIAATDETETIEPPPDWIISGIPAG